MVIDEVRRHESYVIYGAQVIAVGARVAIEHLTGIGPKSFAVGKSKGKASYPLGNPDKIDDILVVPIETVPVDTFIVVGVTELIQKEVLPYLEEHDYKNVYPLTQHKEHLLMSAYFASIGKFPVAEVSGDVASVDLAMYEVRNHRDKVLSTRPSLQEFEHTIQAGAAMTEERIAPLLDNVGENISSRNRQYCEMTATYWVWKNTNHDWKGIEHYRRHLLVKPEMLTEDVDAILPLPYICYPNTLTQFCRFVSEDVLQALLKALKDLHPEEYDEYLSILQGQYQYTYNLVCARENVFEDYCTWFFRITEYIEGMADGVPEIENTRALSYVAEVLTNLYFMSHQDVWRIRHVEKAIYV